MWDHGEWQQEHMEDPTWDDQAGGERDADGYGWEDYLEQESGFATGAQVTSSCLVGAWGMVPLVCP